MGLELRPEKLILDTSKLSTDAARAELDGYAKNRGGESYTWGYFPQLNPDPKECPSSIELSKQLEEYVLPFVPGDTDWQLAFIRVATQRPVSDFGGLHIDVDWGIRHKRDPAAPKGKEIKRLLINLGNHPRVLEYVDPERFSDIDKNKYEILKDQGDTEEVNIPPLEKDGLWYLTFWSSLIPHAGVTDDRGHFLAAYGTYANLE